MLTEYEVKALRFLKLCGASGARASVIGHEILPEEIYPSRRSAQGAALFAGRFLNRLKKKRFVCSCKNGWAISVEGKNYLAQLSKQTT